MYFISFAQVVHEIGHTETRSIDVFPNDEVPAGSYGFLELYCTDPKCDCRLVRFMVIGEKGEEHATITYGWENKEFYDKALFCPDHNFPGPDLASVNDKNFNSIEDSSGILNLKDRSIHR